MLRSLLRQDKQIRSSGKYKDLSYIDGGQGDRELDGNIHDQDYVENVQTLEDDLNILRAQLREVIGGGTWYAKPEVSLAEIKLAITEKETELEYIRRHEKLYHHKRDDNTVFEFNEDNLTSIKVYDTDNNLRQDSVFEYNGEILLSITKTIWDDDLSIYVEQKKIFNYDTNGNLLNIENIIL